jgi:YhcH/YjgK/YiaL family protein
MILDSLDQASRYAPLHASFKTGFDFLRNRCRADLADGEVPIDGDRVFAIVARSKGRGRPAARLEAHRRYIDIQYVIEGHEVIGWSRLAGCVNPEAPYDREKDIIFFRDRAQTWFDVAPGSFAIFFPEDAHAPLAGEGPVLKIVIKVQV